MATRAQSKWWLVVIFLGLSLGVCAVSAQSEDEGRDIASSISATAKTKVKKRKRKGKFTIVTPGSTVAPPASAVKPKPSVPKDPNEADNSKPLPAIMPGTEGEKFPSFLVPPEKWSVHVAPETHAYQFGLSAGPTNLRFIPNTNSLLVVGANYAPIGGLSYSFKMGLNGDSTKGSSRYEDWRFNFPFRALNVFLVYSRYSGFYLDDTAFGNSAQPNLLYPNLYVQTYGAHVTWVVNSKKFSMAAMMDQTERQIKTGASFILGLSATQTTFRNSDGFIVPVKVQSSFGNDAGMMEGQVRALSVRGGGACTWVFTQNRKWSLSLLGTVGIGPQEITITTDTDTYTMYHFTGNQFDMYFNGGYNGDQWFSGVSAFISETFTSAEDSQVQGFLSNAGIYLGTRF